MKRYHIMFRLGTHGVATGKNYEANDEIKALRLFWQEYPEATFLYIASSAMFDYKY
jgi:hypothetical protein